MRTKYARGVIVLIVLLTGLSFFQPAAADTGPKPSMDFVFIQAFSGPQLTIRAGTQFECDQADCSDAQAFKKLGPQHFGCKIDTCRSIGYGYKPYHRLEIIFSDGKTRQSNVFETAGFNSEYKVTIRPDDLLVETEKPLVFSSPAHPKNSLPTPTLEFSSPTAPRNTPHKIITATAENTQPRSPVPYLSVAAGASFFFAVVAGVVVLALWRRFKPQ